MKFLTPPAWDDNTDLTALANDDEAESYPDLLTETATISERYESYISNAGDPLVITPLGLVDPQKKWLLRHYNRLSTRDQMINIREDSSIDVCSMCGSPSTHSIDHFFPKDSFPEYSFFSRNLVPACSCNRNGRQLVDSVNGLRILHPYFDACMENRLVRARFVGDMLTPTFKLDVCCGDIPEKAFVEFHVKKVIQGRRIGKFFGNLWRELRAKPTSVIFTMSRHRTAISEHTLRENIEDLLEGYDDWKGTPNNWYSMFFAGLLKRRLGVRWLAEDISDLYAGRRQRED